jgi:Tfp pilus assembly protein FimT
MAAPSVSHWLWRSRVENTARAWTADLQSARLQALRTGQALQLQKLTDCADFLPMGDWRCGWQVITAGSKPTATLQHALNGELSVMLFPANDFLPINTQGAPVASGLRLQVMTRSQPSPVAMSVCMNIAGRLRLVKSGGAHEPARAPTQRVFCAGSHGRADGFEPDVFGADGLATTSHASATRRFGHATSGCHSPRPLATHASSPGGGGFLPTGLG